MRSRCNIRGGSPLENSQYPARIGTDLIEQAARLFENGMPDKQGVDVKTAAIINVVAVQSQDASVPNIEPGTTQHP